ncbi:response regulator transcription factor [Pseudemcibacter aquimaris]|uniref:response regulator transcription factor n=1 Tax=Pseudemcibacter aquimaris TaxID=2857064 RepID=UPI002013B11A|nr:response regulator transcription factor [Pseudemcibacter aquimaris]MCC3861546.1 response regulator transcription factor [Pseudemcibacter aquimaris]WDU58315.1 response regulator transcription factor [Pseudemcibacter aquimaris]
MRLLLVEDDPKLGPRLADDLKSKGFAVDLITTGEDAEFMGNEISYDVVILDIGLPDISGLEVLKNWRKDGNASAVLILTARDDWQERVDGFQAGADDYLGKPFHFEELLERLNALIRRTKKKVTKTMECGDIKLDENRQSVIKGDKEHPLTGTEFRLLRYMILHQNEILSKGHLTDHIYDDGSDKDSNVIEVYVRRLRNLLGAEYIKTKRGQGYIFGIDQ